MLVMIFVQFVVEIDGVQIGDGVLGCVVMCLWEIYIDESCKVVV